MEDPMKRTTLLFIAALLVGLLAVTAGGAWASQSYKGTVPKPDKQKKDKCPKVVDMGTALFTPLGKKCDIDVEWIGNDTGEYALPPEGLACLSDTFEVHLDPADTLVKVCYAYPPEFAEKEARIYRLNEEATPPVWVEVPGAKTRDGVICVTTTAGYFALIGKP
jgi:hypothetical protein